MNGVSNFWSGRRVLVTGGTGLLGSWLTIALIDAGAEVISLIFERDPHSVFSQSIYENQVYSINGDVTDFRLLERVVTQFQPQTVFHLAAQALVTIAERDPWNTFETNVRGTWNVLEAAKRQTNPPQVIIASSDKAYGDQAQLPYTEQTPLQGRYPYDASKSCADLVALSYAHTYNLPVAVTRCGNIFGGGDMHWDRIIPCTIRAAFLDERPVLRSDGTLTRDYLYVQDIVHAYMMLAERLNDPAVWGQAFNFGLDDPKTVLEIMQATLQAAGRPDLEPIILGKAEHEIKHQYLDATKARTILGWKPKYDLATALQETVAWYGAYWADAADRAVY